MLIADEILPSEIDVEKRGRAMTTDVRQRDRKTVTGAALGLGTRPADNVARVPVRQLWVGPPVTEADAWSCCRSH